MARWVYLASAARATEAEMIRFAMDDKILARTSHNVESHRIANVAHLRPGDEILLAYRRGLPFHAVIRATIAAPEAPADGTAIIDCVDGQLAAALVRANYHARPDGRVDVIHLSEVEEVDITLHGAYRGNNAIRRPDPEDFAKFPATR